MDEGDHRGRLLGFPTANIALGDHLRPALGVYAVRVGIVGNGPDRLTALDEPEVWHDGVANLGIRPMYALPEPIDPRRVVAVAASGKRGIAVCGHCHAVRPVGLIHHRLGR